MILVLLLNSKNICLPYFYTIYTSVFDNGGIFQSRYGIECVVCTWLTVIVIELCCASVQQTQRANQNYIFVITLIPILRLPLCTYAKYKLDAYYNCRRSLSFDLLLIFLTQYGKDKWSYINVLLKCKYKSFYSILKKTTYIIIKILTIYIFFLLLQVSQSVNCICQYGSLVIHLYVHLKQS